MTQTQSQEIKSEDSVNVFTHGNTHTHTKTAKKPKILQTVRKMPDIEKKPLCVYLKSKIQVEITD